MCPGVRYSVGLCRWGCQGPPWKSGETRTRAGAPRYQTPGDAKSIRKAGFAVADAGSCTGILRLSSRPPPALYARRHAQLKGLERRVQTAATGR